MLTDSRVIANQPPHDAPIVWCNTTVQKNNVGYGSLQLPLPMRKRIKSIKAVCAEKKGWIKCLDLHASPSYHAIHYHALFIALPNYA